MGASLRLTSIAWTVKSATNDSFTVINKQADLENRRSAFLRSYVIENYKKNCKKGFTFAIKYSIIIFREKFDRKQFS
jgi:hypothetical protein